MLPCLIDGSEKHVGVVQVKETDMDKCLGSELKILN
jgi:hypothetical protein